MELSQIARVALGGQLHTMLTSETTIDNHHHTMLTPKTTVHTFAQLHTTHPRSPKPKLGHWKTIVHCPAYYNYSPPPLPTGDLYLNLFCAAGVQGGLGGWPDWTQIRSRVKNSPAIHSMARTTDRFLTSVGFTNECRDKTRFSTLFRFSVFSLGHILAFEGAGSSRNYSTFI